MHLHDLLKLAVDSGASDLHLKVGSVPSMRIGGELMQAAGLPSLCYEDLETMSALVHAEGYRQRSSDHEADLGYSVPGLGRFRCNIFRQRGATGMVFRVIPATIPSLDSLGLPPVLASIANEKRGLVLVTGATGSGKSTTLAAIVDHINRTRRAHIITIEDPIEFFHTDQQSIVNQREVASDTPSFGRALRSALRQDPDVILVGEMRDHDTIKTGLLAAETGHLVCSTLHTLNATEAINRIVAVFPPYQQKQIRAQMATVLKAVISQRLLPRRDGNGRVPAVEVMISTPFIRDCVLDQDKTHEIHDAIVAGASQYGMQSFDQSILTLYEQGLVSYEEALRWASNVDEFKLQVQGIGTASAIDREEKTRAASAERASIPVTRFGR